jgi:hypothetical protein
MLLKRLRGQQKWLRNDFDPFQAMSGDVLRVKHVFWHRKSKAKQSNALQDLN